jgi:Isochorismatase family
LNWRCGEADHGAIATKVRLPSGADLNIISPMKSALLVVDIQRDLFESTPRPYEADKVVERINSLASRARSVVPLVTSKIDGQTFAVVNVNTFEDVKLPALPRAAMSFEGEEIDGRLSRRKRNWIATVRFSRPGA